MRRCISSLYQVSILCTSHQPSRGNGNRRGEELSEWSFYSKRTCAVFYDLLNKHDSQKHWHIKAESCVISVLILGVSSASIGCFQELKVFVQKLYTVLSRFSCIFSLNSIAIFKLLLCHGWANPGRQVAVAGNFLQWRLIFWILGMEIVSCHLDFYWGGF
jgi:hypothetical protein